MELWYGDSTQLHFCIQILIRVSKGILGRDKKFQVFLHQKQELSGEDDGECLKRCRGEGGKGCRNHFVHEKQANVWDLYTGIIEKQEIRGCVKKQFIV